MLTVINFALGWGTVLLLAGIVAFGYLAAARKLSHLAAKVGARRAMGAIAALAWVATLTSLYYSDVAGFAPCVLCWWQRIAMYPIALIAAIALFRRDVGHAMPYVGALSWIGLAVGIFQVNLQAGVVSSSSAGFCGVGEAIACDVPPFVTLGFVTLPVASAAGFAAILAAVDVARRALRREHQNGETR